MKNDFVGYYYIEVTAFIKNVTYSESHKSRFKLTILPQKLPEAKV